jgi:hypothetical protein
LKLTYLFLGALALPMLADVKSAAPGYPVGSLEDQTATCISAGGPVGACVAFATNPKLLEERVVETYDPPADVKSAAPGFPAGSVEDQVATCIRAGGPIGACVSAVMPWKSDCAALDLNCLPGSHRPADEPTRKQLGAPAK